MYYIHMNKEKNTEKPREAGLYAVVSKGGSSETVAEPIATYMVRRIREGLPIDELQALCELLECSEDALAKWLGISKATLHRRKKAGFLDSSESERVVRAVRLFARAEDVLDSKSAAREWLKSPARALGGESPLDYTDTEVGAREVENLLGRIEHGVFS